MKNELLRSKVELAEQEVWPILKYQFIYLYRDTIGSRGFFVFHIEDCLFKRFHGKKWGIFGGIYADVINTYGVGIMPAQCRPFLRY